MIRDVYARIARIRASLRRIEQLMAALKVNDPLPLPSNVIPFRRKQA